MLTACILIITTRHGSITPVVNERPLSMRIMLSMPFVLGSVPCGVGVYSATDGAGAGLASWREVAARDSDVTDRADEAAKALRACYEAAVEALGRAGRWEQALEVNEVHRNVASSVVSRMVLNGRSLVHTL